MTAKQNPHSPNVVVERITELRGNDLHDLCDAADAAIVDGGGFGWLTPPPRHVMETYWRGVLVVPERELFVARLDGTIAGSAQLQRPPKNNEAQMLTGQLNTFFLAPWARGYGLAAKLVQAVEDAAKGWNLDVLNLDVRETQSRAIEIYEQLGFTRWGSHPHYAWTGEFWVSGHFFYKLINNNGGASAAAEGSGA